MRCLTSKLRPPSCGLCRTAIACTSSSKRQSGIIPDARSMSARPPKSSCPSHPDVPCDAPPRREREGFGYYWARLHLLQGATKSQQQLRCEYQQLNAGARQHFEDYIVAQERRLSHSTESPGVPDLPSTPLKKRKLDEPGSSSHRDVPPDVLMPSHKCLSPEDQTRSASPMVASVYFSRPDVIL